MKIWQKAKIKSYLTFVYLYIYRVDGIKGFLNINKTALLKKSK